MERHCILGRDWLLRGWKHTRPSPRSTIPGWKAFAQHDLANRQMALPGGMIAFDLKGGLPAGLDDDEPLDDDRARGLIGRC